MTEGDAAAEDDDEERSASGPLLPPEDRLWRHPSELASLKSASLDPLVVRTRWLERQPSRASAWTAGVVGALLATGIVLVGTHLATFLTRSPVIETSASSVVPISPGTTVPGSAARGYGLGANLDAALSRLGDETVAVHAFWGSDEIQSLGVVLDADGMVVTAAGAVRGATSILVDPPHGGTELVATIGGLDARSGLAILHVNGLPELPAADLSGQAESGDGSFVIAITSTGGSTYAPADLTSLNITPKVGGSEIVDATETDLAASYAPLGSPVLDGSGRLVGMIVGTVSGHAVVTPTWILEPVADQLAHFGAVTQGWMGINGSTVKTTKEGIKTPGVHVLAVTPHSAASIAGIRSGDEITAIDGRRVTSIAALQGRLYGERPGTTITVRLLRDAHPKIVDVTLAGTQS